MIRREQVHVLQRGRRHRRAAKGHRRKSSLHLMISPQLQLSLMNEAVRNHATIGLVVERALGNGLGQIAARKGARLHERLRHANALITEVIAAAHVVSIAGEVSIPGQAKPANIHEKEPRKQRRNRISEKAAAAFEEVYELAQTEAVATANRTRAAMYMALARLAEVNEALLKDASDEEVMAEIEKLREDQERFEEATRKLEEETKEPATAK